MEHLDVIVLGGGAAGLFCALTAGGRGRRVLVLEHNDSPGRKILISGGGRCNFTNIHAAPANYISHNPGFCRSALARFTPADFVAIVESHGIRWHEKKLGQLFCDRSSRDILELLLDGCRQAGAEVRCGVRVHEVSKPGRFHLHTSHGELSCDALVVATGGLSFPKLGATGLGYDTARRFDLRITETRPGLVPLTLQGAQREALGALSGVALPVRAALGAASFADDLLITHRGFSGPAVLQISNFWREGNAVEFDLLPGHADVPARGHGTAVSQLAQHWPKRFAELWCAHHAPLKPTAQWTARERDEVQRNLHHWRITFSGTEGYPKAEVTLGGVDTRDLSSKTMEARNVPGLCFIGEVVDVTGWLGGYNFQWAWASASAAGNAV